MTRQGIFGGSLNVPYASAVDSKGYVGENFDGRHFANRSPRRLRAAELAQSAEAFFNG
jgi:hypothetical protein